MQYINIISKYFNGRKTWHFGGIMIPSVAVEQYHLIIRLEQLLDPEPLLVKLEQSKKVTFKQCYKRYIKAHRAGWSNAKHAAQWTSTLKTYAVPLHQIPVDEIDTDLILSCLEPIWTDKSRSRRTALWEGRAMQ